MVVFDNLGNILGSCAIPNSTGDGVNKEWKILGEETKSRLVVGWTVDNGSQKSTCVGVYSPLQNKVKRLLTLNGAINVVQASIDTAASLVSYVTKDESCPPVYTQYLSATNEMDDSPTMPVEGATRTTQIMTTFLSSLGSPKGIRLLVMMHLEAVQVFHISIEDNTLKIMRRDAVAGQFSWAQWEITSNCLYFIHFRKVVVYEEDGEREEQAPTLTALQFHSDLPHETVLNIPLNLPSLSKEPSDGVGIYEDDCVPLRVHDCSLDLLVMTDMSGFVCICHHYLYQPVKPPTAEESDSTIDDNTTVHFAYSVTLLHHGCVIHCAMPGVPWSSAKALRPGFTMLGSQYLLIHGPGVLTHVLDVGLAHEPICHILLPSKLAAVEKQDARLVALHSKFADSDDGGSDAMQPSVMLDLNSLDLLEVEVTAHDLLVGFEEIKAESNRLAILHYFLVHLGDMDLVEEALSYLGSSPHDINCTLLLKEVLVGGTYSITRRNLTHDTANILCLLPLTCLHPTVKYEIKIKGRGVTLSQEILWNTAMMLLSPQQRLVPYRMDLWIRMWDKLSTFTETPRFKHVQVADKLSVSLACYQPEVLSRCTTPMSPAPGFLPSFVDLSGLGQVPGPRKLSTQLPFFETDSSTANKQEHIISVNQRELNMYLMKNSLREAPIHVHSVTTRYVTAQLDMSKQLCQMICAVAGITDLMVTRKGFQLIQELDEYRGQLLLTLFLRYHHASQMLAFPLPLGFASFFCYLGFTFLPFTSFLSYLHSNVFQLQVDVMKEVLRETGDSKENMLLKLRLLQEMPRSRAKRLLNTWNHPASLMIRAREHSLNILSGVEGSKPKIHIQARRLQDPSGYTEIPSLDTFLNLLTAKASLTELDFNLLIEATQLSAEDIL